MERTYGLFFLFFFTHIIYSSGQNDKRIHLGNLHCAFEHKTLLNELSYHFMDKKLRLVEEDKRSALITEESIVREELQLSFNKNKVKNKHFNPLTDVMNVSQEK